MSEELSRVKSRQKQYKGEAPSTVKIKPIEPSPKEASTQREIPAGNLSRAGRAASRTKTNKTDKVAMEGEGARQDKEATPSRARTYTSERVRLSKMFVNSLIFIFVILLAFLLWWGIEGAPKLRTLLW
ncbi:hypothetical protein PaeBR_10580 [Paenibacillus sp. BR2-3]|uniref:hypothetical protein n=1 Tax=Paenibacillus sp. BR2-3 TaxID=3048494 RepID=UPI003977D876